MKTTEMAELLTFLAVRARQAEGRDVLSFAATATEVLQLAQIERAGRNEGGELFGFQRPQIASHIREIRDYLTRPDAVLPNAIVVAFTHGVSLRDRGDGIVELAVDVTNGPPGLVVDGQQRLTAASGIAESNFQLFVSALICPTEDELRKQFVLINNTRPLPKALIYELLPSVQGLPARLGARSIAAMMTERLNYLPWSSLQGDIFQHTNPVGRIRDTAIQKVIMNSLSDGAMRELRREPDGDRACIRLISEFFHAVQLTFPDAWDRERRRPANSRLVHGAGIVAMGYVMELLFAVTGARECGEFMDGLRHLQGRCAWTEGYWQFGPEDRRPWNRIQNVSRDIMLLADYLVRVTKVGLREDADRRAHSQTAESQSALL